MSQGISFKVFCRRINPLVESIHRRRALSEVEYKLGSLEEQEGEEGKNLISHQKDSSR